MPTDVILPQMGESITEGTITKWRISVGDEVERDDPLFDLATDKVDTEVPAAITGRLAEILVPEGETVPVNTVVARIAAPGEPLAPEAPEAVAPPEPAPGAAPPAAPPAAPDEGAESPAPVASESPLGAPGPEAGGGRRKRPRSSPLVRRMAREHGVDLAEVPGTGEGGRVGKRDMLAWIERLPAAPPPVPVEPAPAPREPVLPEPAPAQPAIGVAQPAIAPAQPAIAQQPVLPQAPPVPVAPAEPLPAEAVSPPAAPEPLPPVPEPPGGFAPEPAAAPPGPGGRAEPLSRMRRSIAEHMVRSRRTAAHVTTVFEVDMSAVVAVRERQGAAFEERTGVRLTLMPFFARAAVEALGDFPVLNASLRSDRIHYHRTVDLGIAVALPDGLLVPVLHRAEERNFVGLARGISDLAARARSGALRAEELAGGTFTITNPGPYGALFGTPIIAQPQSAILGIGGVHKRAAVVAGDAIAARSMVFLALSFDHRLIDGAVADRFLGAVKARLEGWREDAV